MQGIENAVQLVNRQDLTHPGVMIEDDAAAIFGTVEIAHARLRAAHKSSIAENHPGLFGSWQKCFPESRKDSRRWFLRCVWLRFVTRKQISDDAYRDYQQSDENQNQGTRARYWLVHDFLGMDWVAGDQLWFVVRALMESQKITALGHLENEGISCPFRTVVSGQL